MKASLVATWTLAAAYLIACGDPTVDTAIDSLGPETPGVPEGPLHRPGQPCVTCHQDKGNALPFSIAGTVYQYENEPVPLRDAIVTLIDRRGRGHRIATNCAGNFFVQPGEFRPDYPLRIAVSFGGLEVQMKSLVYREGSCAECHRHPATAENTAHVYLLPLRGSPPGYELPPQECL